MAKFIQSQKWAFVTGASGGIGRATAVELARAGWNVGVHYHTLQTAAIELVGRIQSMGRTCFSLPGDFGKPQGIEELIKKAWDQSGGIDTWIHIAGADVLTGENARLSFAEKLDRTIQVDLVGTILACRVIGRRMQERGGGSIVTIGWDQSATGMEGDSGEMFAATKGGVAAFSRSLAKSLAPAVRVNCVAPGWIQTAWGKGASQAWHDRVKRETPLGRWGTPEDVAKAIVFLVSEEATFLTGQTINVNGGVVTG